MFGIEAKVVGRGKLSFTSVGPTFRSAHETQTKLSDLVNDIRRTEDRDVS